MWAMFPLALLCVVTYASAVYVSAVSDSQGQSVRGYVILQEENAPLLRSRSTAARQRLTTRPTTSGGVHQRSNVGHREEDSLQQQALRSVTGYSSTNSYSVGPAHYQAPPTSNDYNSSAYDQAPPTYEDANQDRCRSSTADTTSGARCMTSTANGESNIASTPESGEILDASNPFARD